MPIVLVLFKLFTETKSNGLITTSGFILTQNESNVFDNFSEMNVFPIFMSKFPWDLQLEFDSETLSFFSMPYFSIGYFSTFVLYDIVIIFCYYLLITDNALILFFIYVHIFIKMVCQ